MAAVLTPATATSPLPAAPASPSLWQAVSTLALRDLRIAGRRRADTLACLAFFVMVGSLFPLALGPEPALLARLAGGVLWVAALLAALLPLTRLFDDDLADGTLEQLLLSPHSLPLLVLGKVLAHWLSSGAWVTLAAPLVALMYGVPAEGLWALAASLLLGTPILSLLGAVTAALATGLRGGALLLALMVLPLAVRSTRC
jgi:heme exporter protein B